MKKQFKYTVWLSFLLFFTIIFTTISPNAKSFTMVYPHSGRTDSSGGHKDNQNKSGLGSYHYHCVGNPAHLHTNGVCPYTTSSDSLTSNSNTTTKKSTSASKSSDIKKVQKALNKLGYDCGTPDGIAGKKTKKAVKQYQKDNDLKVDGIIGKGVKKSLGI